LAAQEEDPLVAKQIRLAAKRMLRQERSKNFRQLLNDTAANRTHFRLAQLIFNKEFIRINKNKWHFPDTTAKAPSVSGSVEHTQSLWKKF